MKVPTFTLQGRDGNINSEEFEGSPTILVFYPRDGTNVCTNQLALYNEILPMFEKFNASIYGISVDGSSSHRKFEKSLNLKYQLLSDDNPKGEVSKKFGVYDEKLKQSKRAIFVLDEHGNISWRQIVPYEINPGAEGILRALEDLIKQKN